MPTHRGLGSRRRWCPSVEAAGTGLTSFGSLAGATLEAKINTATQANRVSFGPGTFTWSDFTTVTGGVRAGVAVTRGGLTGTGAGNTIFQMNANTSTRSAEVPTTTGTTNQLYLMTFDQDNLYLGCFTVQGTNQGHLYNGIRLIGVANGTLKNLKLINPGPGNNFFPPGETFGINDFQGNNNKHQNIEIDGRPDGATGAGTGATAFGANSSVGGTYRDCLGHHNPYSAAFALWQGSGTVNLFDCGGHHNRTHLNLERMGGEIGGQRPACTINVYDFEFGNYQLNELGLGFGQDIFLGNDQGSTVLNIYRPVFTPNRIVSTSGRDPNKIFIWWPVNEQNNPNLQQKSDVHVFDANGNEIPQANIIQWSR